MAAAKPVYSISVRDLVSFLLRTGNLRASGHFTGPNRALAGTLGHQRLQKSRPAGYLPEVFVSYLHETADFIFELKGRIDGVQQLIDSLIIEEIKTTYGPWSGPADPLHLAQARTYAWLYSRDHPCSNISLQITYLDLDSGLATEFCEPVTATELDSFFQRLLEEYLQWLQSQHQWMLTRNSSIAEIAFPFDSYRAGQRSLAVAVYHALSRRHHLFAEAPTGIGKTISVLFPAIKALGEGAIEKIFYLTAKTIGRTVAGKSLHDLRAKGLRLRSLTLTAKDKICFNNGQPCDMSVCPFAIGYYDRIKNALRDGLTRDCLDRPAIEELARKHQVCPFELSLDLALWCDAIICDYNYAFDPSASLKRFFSEDERRDYALLIDEAHNLLDRAREMFSADLELSELNSVKKELKFDLPACARAIGKITSRLNTFKKEEGWTDRNRTLVSKSLPSKIAKPIQTFLDEAELWLAREQPAPFRQALLDLYFRVLAFRRTTDLYDDHYVTTYDPAIGRLKLFCLDPSSLLSSALSRIASAIFFSATLTPLEFFRAALGGTTEDTLLQLVSPFPPDNLAVLIHDRIQTRFSARASSYDAVAASISALVSRRVGNYLVYFPSYDYLRQVRDRFQTLHPDCSLAAQTPAMTEDQREQFLANFACDPSKAFVAFAVMGGIFGEGIDLVGERLIGVAIVGVGLPQLCLERDLIREYHDALGRSGFDFAYTFPGMNRVLQAAGRVIRTETDRGTVLLIDDRFSRAQYRSLLPQWWKPQLVRAIQQIAAKL